MHELLQKFVLFYYYFVYIILLLLVVCNDFVDVDMQELRTFHKLLRSHEKTSTFLPPQWAPCFKRLQSSIPKLCMHNVASYFIYTFLLWLKNRTQAVFCAYKLRSNSFIALSFHYLEVVTGSLGGATEQLLVLRAHGIPTY